MLQTSTTSTSGFKSYTVQSFGTLKYTMPKASNFSTVLNVSK